MPWKDHQALNMPQKKAKGQCGLPFLTEVILPSSLIHNHQGEMWKKLRLSTTAFKTQELSQLIQCILTNTSNLDQSVGQYCLP